jgi:hypothetical protein
MKSAPGNSCFIKTIFLLLFFFITTGYSSTLVAQTVLFDFDSIPVHTPFPVSQARYGITANFSATGIYGYSIQDANAMGFTPKGFSGHVIYPNSVYPADLLIKFDKKITDFSIMYACQELGCDDAATMRATAYSNGAFVATGTRIATFPGTWPVDTLRCSFSQGFDSIVVHYDKRPPTCQDYGPIFLADNMQVTVYNPGAVSNAEPFIEKIIIPNPVSDPATLSLWLYQPRYISITVYDITGKCIKNLFNGYLNTGEQNIKLDPGDPAFKNGLYLLKVSGADVSASYKLVIE